MSRSAATNWTRGYKAYRDGVEVGFVAPLDPLEVRPISTRYLSQDERIEIADLRREGLSMRAIADRLDRDASTISRELRRNAAPGSGYQPFDAHRRTTARRARHRRRLEINEHLGVVVTELLGQRWSPQQITRHSPQVVLPGAIDPCGCATRASIRRSINRTHGFCGPATGASSDRNRHSSTFTAAHRSRSSPRTAVPPAPAAVPAADADHP